MHKLKKYTKLLSTLIWVLLTFTTIFPNAHAGQYEKYLIGKIITVRDGYTIQVRVANTDEILEIRSYGTNAPQKNKPYHTDSKNFLKFQIQDKLIENVITDNDRFPYYLLTSSQAMDLWTIVHNQKLPKLQIHQPNASNLRLCSSLQEFPKLKTYS